MGWGWGGRMGCWPFAALVGRWHAWLACLAWGGPPVAHQGCPKAGQPAKDTGGGEGPSPAQPCPAHRPSTPTHCCPCRWPTRAPWSSTALAPSSTPWVSGPSPTSRRWVGAGGEGGGWQWGGQPRAVCTPINAGSISSPPAQVLRQLLLQPAHLPHAHRLTQAFRASHLPPSLHPPITLRPSQLPPPHYPPPPPLTPPPSTLPAPPPQVCGTIKWRLNNKSAKIRQQAADLISRWVVVVVVGGWGGGAPPPPLPSLSVGAR